MSVSGEKNKEFFNFLVDFGSYSVSDPLHFDADPDTDPRIRFWDNGSGSGSGTGSNSNFFLLLFF